MKLNPAQLGAIFEKMKNKPGQMNPRVPKVPTPHPKMLAPIAPPQIPGTPNPNVSNNPNQVNPNFIGEGKAQRFKRIKSMFGL
jgi:hypothetical protein